MSDKMMDYENAGLMTIENFAQSLSKFTQVEISIFDANQKFVSKTSHYLKGNLNVFTPIYNEYVQKGIEKCATTKEPYVSRIENSDFNLGFFPVKFEEKIVSFVVLGPFRKFQQKPCDSPIIPHLENLELINCTRAFFEEEITDFIKYFSHLDSLLDKVINLKNDSEILVKQFKEIEKTNLESISRLKNIMDKSDLMVVVSDFVTDKIVYCNDKFYQLVNEEEEKVKNKKCSDFFGEFDGILTKATKEVLVSEKLSGSETKNNYTKKYLHKLGIWAEISCSLSYWIKGELVIITRILDNSKSVLLENQLFRRIYYDEKLNLPNVIKLEEDLESLPPEMNVALISVDVLSLRKINSNYSNKVGDNLLGAVSTFLFSLDSNSSSLYRVEGDQFILPVFDKTLEDLNEFGEKIRLRFEKNWDILDDNNQLVPIFCGSAVGIIPSKDKIQNKKTLLYNIDSAMMLSKQRNEFIIFDSELEQEIKKYVELEIKLKNSVFNNMEGFSICYDPIVGARDYVWRSIEVLCRYKVDTDESIKPKIFIPILERLGLINKVGLWVLEKSVKECSSWNVSGKDTYHLSVNVSSRQLMDQDFDQSVFEILEKYNFPYSRLNLEIVENNEINFGNDTMQLVTSMRERGIEITLDGFGSGFSTFNTLVELPINIVKTDKSLLKDIENDENVKKLYFLINDLAKIVNIKTVSRGIETEEQKKIAQQSDAYCLQGIFFGKPKSAAEIQAEYFHFSEVSSELLHPKANRVDILENQREKSGYLLKNNYERCLRDCVKLIFFSKKPKNVLKSILQIVGESINVSKSFLFLLDENEKFFLEEDWSVPEAVSISKYFKNREESDKTIRKYEEKLRQDGVYLYSFVNGLKDQVDHQYKDRTLTAYFLFPIFRGEKIIAVLGFSDITKVFVWDDEMQQFYYNLAVIVSNYLKKLSTNTKGFYNCNFDMNYEIDCDVVR